MGSGYSIPAGKMGFGNARGRAGNNREVLLPAELNLKQAKGNSVDMVLGRFKLNDTLNLTCRSTKNTYSI